MIVQRLPVVLLLLIKALEAAVPSLNDLNSLADETAPKMAVPSIARLSNQLSQITLGDEIPKEQTDEAKHSSSLFEISEQMEKLIGAISALDTKTAVEAIEKGLDQLLDSGVCLSDIAPTVGSLPIEAKELVLTALELKAHTLLNLLQMVYIWRDDHQYHWFMALIENEPWHNKDLRNDPVFFPLNWRNNLRAICEADNVALAAMLKEEALQKGTLSKLDEELVPLCAEYDAIKIFESTQLDPVKLGEHLELLAKYSAVRLLRSYQIHTKAPHLHLEELPFPKKLPVDVGGLKFLMENGYNCLPMDKLIRKCCKEGRLDLLKHLQRVDPVLIPGMKELTCAAKQNFREILDWTLQFKIDFRFFEVPVYSICEKLLENRHFSTLCWWVEANKIIVDQRVITKVAEFGALEFLQWIDSKHPGNCGTRETANSAAVYRHLPILEWLYEKYEILPNAGYLGFATGEMLDWIKSKSDTIENPLVAMRLDGVDVEYEYLVEYGAGNFELLQWVFKNAPLSVFDTKKERISNYVRSKEMMLWLYENLSICPSGTNWACETGDLEAIEWAAENCGTYPGEDGARAAALGGHFHIITWIHRIVYPKNPLCFNSEALRVAIRYGNLEIAEYLMVNVFPETNVKASTRWGLCTDKRLATLKWAHEHRLRIDEPSYEILKIASGDDIKMLERISVELPTIKLYPEEEQWNDLIVRDLHKSYKWLLERYPDVRGPSRLVKDLNTAYNAGSLGILKVLYEKDPSLFQSFVWRPVTLTTYHIDQWFLWSSYSNRVTGDKEHYKRYC